MSIPEPTPMSASFDSDASPSQSDTNNANTSLDSRSFLPGSTHNDTPTSNGASAPNRLLLPIPISSHNSSQASFTLSEFGEEEDTSTLPPEVAHADVRIASDGSFVETTSGPAARELKRRFDRYHGVNKDVRSPYIVSAIITQHGKQVFRVGHRDNFRTGNPSSHPEPVAPVASATGPPSPTTDMKHPSRRSRMSFNGLIVSGAMKNNLMAAPTPGYVTPAKSRSPPAGPRKLRKTRSTSNLDVAGGNSTTESNRGSQGPPPASGRAHSHSVTAADLPQYAERQYPVVPQPSADMFGNVMGWAGFGPPPLSSWPSSTTRSRASSRSTSRDSYSDTNGGPSKQVDFPFGRNVSFDSPFRDSLVHLPPPPALREMQSFESGLTARAQPRERPIHISPRPDSPTSFLSLTSSSENSPTPPSLSAESYPIPPTPYTHSGPSFETQLHTRYSTSVFDVIQTYRGLPMLDKLSEESHEPTVKLSLSALDSAAPRDDPRFVIWGDIHTDGDNMSMYEIGTDISSMKSGPSRRRSNRGKGAPPVPELRVPSSEPSKRSLMAATIERWIAQLTSTLNYDELLIFFLTYRTYIDPVDLCQLFITRFHWALEVVSSKREQQIRATVRIRTFVAVRYWLLTFFRVDFLPNRDLCLLFANWLNTLRRDPILGKFKDAADVVRRLKKVTRDCKEAHSRSPNTANRQSEQRSKPNASINRVLGDLSNGNFAASLRKIVQDDDDSDVDLDFNLERGSTMYDNVGIQGFASFANQLDMRGDLGAMAPGSNASRQGGTTSRIMLRQPLHMTILQHAMGGPTDTDLPLAQTRTSLPVHHSALSRAVVNTIGRLGRWKRVLSARSSMAPSADSTLVDLELNATGDLLTVRGGVQQYLKMIEPVAPLPGMHSKAGEGTCHDTAHRSEPLGMTIDALPTSKNVVEQEDLGIRTSSKSDHDHVPSAADIAKEAPPPEDDIQLESTSATKLELDDPPSRPLSSESRASSVSMRSPASSPAAHRVVFPPSSSSHSSRIFDTVSIDDLDLSDSSSREDVPALPPGLPKPPRRLPRRREFEFVRRSVDSVSSMGIISYRSGAVVSAKSDSVQSSTSSHGEIVGPVQQWQVDAIMDDLSDDEDDPGDAEAALRRLEGQINTQRQQAKVAKVDGWVKTIQERMANGEFGDDQIRFPSEPTADDDDDNLSDDDYGSNAHARDLGGENEDVTISSTFVGVPSSEEATSSLSVPPVFDPTDTSNVITPTAQQTTHQVNKGAGPPVIPASEGKPRVEEAVPSEILESRLPSRPPTSNGSSPDHKKVNSPLSGSFALSGVPTVHRSFVLAYRSDDIAQHFAVIEREIFLGIEFKELISEDWMNSCSHLNVLDWSQFLRERRRKVELHGRGKASALAAARARFNLVANFTVSEIALSHPHTRPVVVNKFIRIAWKAYLRNNFATMIAIVTALISDWVKKALGRLGHRIGIWETRILEDLKVFSTHEDDFHYIRHAIGAISDAKPGGFRDDSTTSASLTDALSSTSRGKGVADGKSGPPQSCIPFLGVYLSQLHRLSSMPDLIDPSAPTESVRIDPETGNFEAPSYSEVFSTLQPLPSSMQLEPLINVQKQRLIAGVVKSMVAGQHLANKVSVSVDKKLLQRCLRLRALDFNALSRVLSLYPDNN